MTKTSTKPGTAPDKTATSPNKLGDLPSRLLSLVEVAQILGCSMKTLQRRVVAGELPVIRDGRRVLVTPRDLARYIAARRSL